jgi:hypothetical protein
VTEILDPYVCGERGALGAAASFAAQTSSYGAREQGSAVVEFSTRLKTAHAWA